MDDQLLARIRRGDREAFAALVRAHQRDVYRVARSLLGSHEEADEVAQETFIRAWKHLNGYRGECALRTWLIQIALNVARTRRARRRAEFEPEAAPEPADPAQGPEARLETRRMRERIRRAVAGLPPRQREAVVLKVFHGMTYQDVARAMDLSEGAVKAHVHQAVSNLRRRLTA